MKKGISIIRGRFLQFLMLIISFLIISHYLTPVETKDRKIKSLELFILDLWDNKTGIIKDNHSLYIFPLEKNKPLPSFNNFNLTYRKLDIYFAFLLINETHYNKNSKIYPIIKESRKILSKIIPTWRNQTLVVSKNNYTGRIWLDTYCILAYLTRDKKLVENIVRNIDFNGGLWIDENLYRKELVSWRLISDETWCVMAIMRVLRNETLVKRLLRIHINEALKYLNENHLKINKLGSLIHLIMMLNELKREFPKLYTNYEALHKRFIKDAIHIIREESLYNNVDLNANLIWTICRSDFSNEFREDVEFLFKELLKQEKGDGGIYNKEDAKGFLTLQALKAIYAYKRCFD